MSKLFWNQTGDRAYQAGIDRGVLYVENSPGVVWNGLTGIEEDFGDTKTESLYVDGLKYRDIQSTDDFQATLKAFTYPDEFLECEGVYDIDNILVDGQIPKSFGLSYRVKIGNDVNHELGYLIHVIYNLTAIPDAHTYETLTATNQPIEFSWHLTSIPENVSGYRPTAHLVFNTTEMHSLLLLDLEDILYGTETTDPELPSLQELVNWSVAWASLQITDHGDGTWSAKDHGEYITMLDSTTFSINAANASYSDADTYTVSDTPG